MGILFKRMLKGNVWSAIPVPLLYLIVISSEWDQGSGPERRKNLIGLRGTDDLMSGFDEL